MNNPDTFLAIFLGSKTSKRMADWNALSDADRREREQEGMKAWGAWVEMNASSIGNMGGPLGKTKRISGSGTEDVSNAMSVYMVVRAGSHADAAKLFENHPHFTIFPGEAVEVMPVLPIPNA